MVGRSSLGPPACCACTVRLPPVPAVPPAPRNPSAHRWVRRAPRRRAARMDGDVRSPARARPPGAGRPSVHPSQPPGRRAGRHGPGRCRVHRQRRGRRRRGDPGAGRPARRPGAGAGVAGGRLRTGVRRRPAAGRVGRRAGRPGPRTTGAAAVSGPRRPGHQHRRRLVHGRAGGRRRRARGYLRAQVAAAADAHAAACPDFTGGRAALLGSIAAGLRGQDGQLA